MIVTISEKQYELKLGVKAAKMLETKYDCPLSEVFINLGEGKSIDKIVYVFWASLQWKHRDITEEQALDLAEEIGTIGQVYELVGEVIRESQGDFTDDLESEDSGEETDPNEGKQESETA